MLCRRLWTSGALVALCALVCASCQSESGERDIGQVERIEDDWGFLSGVKLDVLWVVSDAEGMCGAQAELREHMGRFTERLTGGAVDVQQAVIGTNMLDSARSGRFRNEAVEACGVDLSACPMSGREELPPLIVKTLDPRYQDEDGQPDAARMAEALGCSAQVGAQRDAPPMGMEAMREALSPALTESFNAGFLRVDARLAVIFVAARDDCSADDHEQEACAPDVPVDAYVTFLEGLKTDLNGESDRGQVFVGALIGPATEDPSAASCRATRDDGATIEGYDGRRYRALLDAFSASYEASVCAPMDASLDGMAEAIEAWSMLRCLSGLSGLPSCEVEGACSEPCLERGGEVCGAERLRFELVRSNVEDPPAGFEVVEGEPGAGECALSEERAVWRCPLVRGRDYTLNDDAACRPFGVAVEMLIDVEVGSAVAFRYP